MITSLGTSKDEGKQASSSLAEFGWLSIHSSIAWHSKSKYRTASKLHISNKQQITFFRVDIPSHSFLPTCIKWQKLCLPCWDHHAEDTGMKQQQEFRFLKLLIPSATLCLAPASCLRAIVFLLLETETNRV